MHMQKKLLIYNKDQSEYIDVTDYVSGEWRSSSGDTSGVGNQGIDGVASTATFRLINTSEVNFNPNIFYGAKVYARYALQGDGVTKIFNLPHTNVYKGSATIYSFDESFLQWIDLNNVTWNDATQKWEDTKTKSTVFNCAIKVRDDFASIEFDTPIPANTSVIVQYMYFDQNKKNLVNWTSDESEQDALLQSNRYVKFLVRKGNLVYHKQTITGTGADTYLLDVEGDRIVSDITVFSGNDAFMQNYTNELKVEGNYVTFGRTISSNETVTIQYCYNDGDWRTTFVGLLGDKIKSDLYGVTCECRDESKVLQATPIKFTEDGKLLSKVLPEKIREYVSAEKSSVKYCGWIIHNNAVVNGTQIIRTNDSIDFTQYFSVNDYVIIKANTNAAFQIASVAPSVITLTENTNFSGDTYPVAYAIKDGIPIETLIQNTIDDNLGANTFMVYNLGYPNGYAPLSIVYPEVNIDWWSYQSLWSFMQKLVNQHGQYIGFRYISEEVPNALTILHINRDNTIARRTKSFVSDFYTQTLDVTDNNDRDAVIVYYEDIDSSGEAIKKIKYAPISYQSLNDLLLNSIRPMIISLDLTSGITDGTQAQTLANNIYKDIANYTQQQTQIVEPLDPHIETFELIEYNYPWLYNGNQKFCINSFEHDYINLKTTSTATNKVLGGIKKWQKYDSQPGRNRPILSNNLTSAAKITAPKNLTVVNNNGTKGSADIIDSFRNTVNIAIWVQWDRPYGFFPPSYQLEYKKANDSWDNAQKVVTTNTKVKIPVQEDSVYNLRVAALNKNGDVGEYSSIISYETGVVALNTKDSSKVLEIRTQEQFDAWFDSLSSDENNPTEPVYNKVIIYAPPDGKAYIKQLSGTASNPLTKHIKANLLIIENHAAIAFLTYQEFRSSPVYPDDLYVATPTPVFKFNCNTLQIQNYGYISLAHDGPTGEPTPFAEIADTSPDSGLLEISGTFFYVGYNPTFEPEVATFIISGDLSNTKVKFDKMDISGFPIVFRFYNQTFNEYTTYDITNSRFKGGRIEITATPIFGGGVLKNVTIMDNSFIDTYFYFYSTYTGYSELNSAVISNNKIRLTSENITRFFNFSGPPNAHGNVYNSTITNNSIIYEGTSIDFSFTLLEVTNLDKSVVSGNTAYAPNVVLTNWVTWSTHTGGDSTVVNNQQ